MPTQLSLKRNLAPIVMACSALLIASPLPVHGQQESQDNVRTVTAQSLQCPDAAVQLWASDMRMCMPDDANSNAAVMLHINQFMVYSSTSGPRGESRLTGPGMWMLTYDRDLLANNHLYIDVMGSPEQLTVGDRGTPQLLQTDHVDNMHAHDTVLGLQIRDVIAIGARDDQHLTLLFAPRGQASVGPVPFMPPARTAEQTETSAGRIDDTRPSSWRKESTTIGRR